jgi:asparagine synthetase B (glutamine-hydrolysing)
LRQKPNFHSLSGRAQKFGAPFPSAEGVMMRSRDIGVTAESDNPFTETVRTSFVQEVLEDLKAAYLEDDRPWIIGFSGGKDSTVLAQFVYYMLARLPSQWR